MRYHFAKLVLPAIFFVLLAGCSATPSTPEQALETRLATVFSFGLEETAKYYLEPIQPRRATLNGLEGLADLAPGFSLDAADASLSAVDLFLSGSNVGTISLPTNLEQTPAAAASAWGLFAAQVVTQARQSTPKLADASEETIYASFFNAMVNGLDTFSGYAGRDEAIRNRASREGYGGIGAILASHPDGAMIESLVPGEPADAAGVLVGDRVVAVDGKAVSGTPLSEIERALRGPVDATVILTLKRSDIVEPLFINVGRKRIVPNTVYLDFMGRAAILRVSGFNQSTTKRVAEAVANAFQTLGADLAGIVLDLRGNPGGLLEEAIHTADLFLDAGLITKAAGRHPDSLQIFRAEPGDIAAGLPITVLINGATASAAEILASALQDHGRAVVIGMSSFGKGSIQTVVDLPNGGELYLTWAKFVAPSGYSLDRLGVMPSVCTSGASDAVTALEAGFHEGPMNSIDILKHRRATNADQVSEDDVRAVLALCPWSPHTVGDIDLAIAEQLLGSPAVYQKAIGLSLVGAS